MESIQDSRSVTDPPDNDLASLQVRVAQLENELKDETESKQLQKEQVSADRTLHGCFCADLAWF